MDEAQSKHTRTQHWGNSSDDWERVLKSHTITFWWARTRAFHYCHMFLSRYQLFQVVVLVNIASHTAAKAHLSTWYLDSQYRLLNIISCGIFLLYSPWRVWHVQTTVEFLTVCLSFTCHTEAGEARQGSRRILWVFKKYWPKKKKCNLVQNQGISV